MGMDLKNFVGKRVHFIGAGGCSMSGLARLMQQLGMEVTGSDRTASHKTEALVQAGIPVQIGHEADLVRQANLVVYSAAIAPDNPERAAARELGIPQIERAELLGLLCREHVCPIGVSGTHGKTTVTAMIAQVMCENGLNPTVHVGGELDAIGGSTRLGGREYFLCEACEFNRTFLQFEPKIALILNIDEDHLDCYRDIDDIEAAFLQFARLVPHYGFVIGCGDDARVRHVLSQLSCRTRTYGIEPQNEIRAENLSYDEVGCACFTATLFGHPLCEVELKVAGEHNVKNALAAIALAEKLSMPMHAVAESLGRFAGAHRRFELTSVTDGVRVYQDYGHNPTEIKNALAIAKLQPHRELWSMWQPHTYSRTKTLFQGFVETFDPVDHLLITDICAARESDPGDISSEMLIAPIRARGVDVHYTPTFDDAEAYLRSHWQPGDLVVTHGCGDIDLLNEQIALHGNTKEVV